MELDYLKIVITIALAVVGWLIGHYFTTRRDIENKRRDLVIRHLIEAYRILTNEISQRDQTGERDLKLEILLSDIQLFGTPEQVELAKQLADDIVAGGLFELDDLTNSLRDELRKQLKLASINGNVKWLRINASKVK